MGKKGRGRVGLYAVSADNVGWRSGGAELRAGAGVEGYTRGGFSASVIADLPWIDHGSLKLKALYPRVRCEARKGTPDSRQYNRGHTSKLNRSSPTYGVERLLKRKKKNCEAWSVSLPIAR